MQINLKWENRNTVDEGTRIYKSNAYIAADNLPAPYAVLGAGANSYSDPDVVRGQVYHYRIETYKGADKAITPNLQVTAVPYMGPGPQTLIAGDMECGFFGELTSVDFISYADFIALVGTGGTANVATGGKWLKFAYKGKILIVSMAEAAKNISWNTLYNKGLVYGVDGSGDPGVTGLAAVNQKTIVTIAGSKFLVRLLKGKPSSLPGDMNATGGNDNDSSYDVATTINTKGCEWDDLMVGVSGYKPASFKGVTLAGYSVTADLSPYGASGIAMSWTQDIKTTGLVLVRGGQYSVTTTYPMANMAYPFYVNYTVNNISNTAFYSAPSNAGPWLIGYRPCLEWIP